MTWQVSETGLFPGAAQTDASLQTPLNCWLGRYGSMHPRTVANITSYIFQKFKSSYLLLQNKKFKDFLMLKRSFILSLLPFQFHMTVELKRRHSAKCLSCLFSPVPIHFYCTKQLKHSAKYHILCSMQEKLHESI